MMIVATTIITITIITKNIGQHKYPNTFNNNRLDTTTSSRT